MKDFEIEDVAYFANGSGQLIKGVVVHKFKHYYQTLYVLEVSTPVDPYYEVRSMSTLSDTPEGPLFWMRNLLGKTGEDKIPTAKLKKALKQAKIIQDGFKELEERVNEKD